MAWTDYIRFVEISHGSCYSTDPVIPTGSERQLIEGAVNEQACVGVPVDLVQLATGQVSVDAAPSILAFARCQNPLCNCIRRLPR